MAVIRCNCEIHLHFLCSNSDNRQGGGGILQLCSWLREEPVVMLQH